VPATGFLTAEAEASPVLRNTLNAPLPMTSLPLRVFAAPFRGEKIASVSVGVELDTRNFRFTQNKGVYADKLDVAVVALDAEGKFHGGDRHTVELNLKPETHRAVQNNGLRVLFRLNLPPGRYQLRAAAHEHGADATGSVFYDLDVPNFSSPSLALSGLLLTSSTAGSTPTARPDPLLEGALPSPPTATRTFGRGETLTLLFQVYARPQPGSGSIDLLTTVRDAAGSIKFRVEEQVDEATLKQAEGAFGYALQIPLADFDPGPHTLRVEARGPNRSGASEAREVPFDVR
jgi:hypothetical protein